MPNRQIPFHGQKEGRKKEKEVKEKKEKNNTLYLGQEFFAKKLTVRGIKCATEVDPYSFRSFICDKNNRTHWSTKV